MVAGKYSEDDDDDDDNDNKTIYSYHIIGCNLSWRAKDRIHQQVQQGDIITTLGDVHGIHDETK